MRFARNITSIAVCALAFSFQPAIAADLDSYERTVATYPNSDMAHYMLANELYKAGFKDRAIQQYRAAFALTRSEQMRQFCQRMLKQLGVNVAGSVSAAGYAVNAPGWMAPASSSPLEKFHDMAHRSRAADPHSDSHRDGVAIFKQTPGAEFDSWITEFRIRYGKAFMQQLNSKGMRQAFGRTQMVFSVDKDHHLRSRLVQTTAPSVVTDCLLDATRFMDGKALLDFPPGVKADGFNFAMAWTYPEYPRTNVSAALRMNDGRASLVRGNQATQGVMNYNDARGSLRTTDVRGTLSSSNVNAALGARDARGNLINKSGASAGAAGKLAEGDVSITTDVAAMLMPRAKPVELKAAPPLKLK